MISKILSITAYTIILFGLIHIYFVTCLEEIDTYALWFTGSGIAIIFAGLINLIRSKSSEKIVFSNCYYTGVKFSYLLSNIIIFIRSYV